MLNELSFALYLEQNSVNTQEVFETLNEKISLARNISDISKNLILLLDSTKF